jgi:tRNA-splicing ligase RtcB
MSDIKFRKIDETRWEIPREGKMHVHGIVYADEAMIADIRNDESPKQVVNVAQLPGIVKHSLAMPDIHWGYGFPIGGVAAFDASSGIISPGGVGYDINCGVRLIRSELEAGEVQPVIGELVDTIFRNVPSGVGSHRKDLRLSVDEEKRAVKLGSKWAVEMGFGTQDDLECTEERGTVEESDPDAVSDRALHRGKDQLGTLGSGNHFIEVDIVDEIFDEEAASAMGLVKGRIAVQIHSGSRGFGYQVCDDFLKVFSIHDRKTNVELPDRQLCYAFIGTPQGRQYFYAMNAAVNYAFANRQLMTHWVRESFEQVFSSKARELQMRLVYDVAHNIAKKEMHVVNGKETELMVHRKGATRAFPAGHPQVPEKYRSIGQPVLIPGDMGRCSYVLAGLPKAMEDTFGTVCHGAGRTMSRTQAKDRSQGHSIEKELLEKGIIVRAASRATLNEEIPEAYKDVTHVVDIVVRAGLAKKVAKLKPLGVIKG